MACRATSNTKHHYTLFVSGLQVIKTVHLKNSQTTLLNMLKDFDPNELTVPLP